MLILFDIDGTLYHGDGTGRLAFYDAGLELFGDRFTAHEFDFSGRLDTWIFGELMQRNGIEVDADLTRRFRALMHHHLRRRIESGQHKVRATPGSVELVERLRGDNGVTLGMLTGNWAENGRLKVRSVGLDPDWFPVCAWGDDAPTRDDLPPIARQRFVECRGGEIEFEKIVIVGDTVHDVQCARAHGCRCLAVETGGGRGDDLRAAGADWVVGDLSATEEILGWLGNGSVR